MQCSLSLLVRVTMLVAPVALAQSGGRYKAGTPLSENEIKGFDFIVGPDGKELPAGRGTAKEGAEIFAKKCALCPWGRMGKEEQSSAWYWAVPATLIAALLRIRRSPPQATIRIRRSRGIISTAQCQPINRDRSLRTKFMRWSHFCSIGTALFKRTTSWMPRLCRRSKCRTGMVSFRQSRCGRLIPRNPVGTERVLRCSTARRFRAAA